MTSGNADNLLQTRASIQEREAAVVNSSIMEVALREEDDVSIRSCWYCLSLYCGNTTRIQKPLVLRHTLPLSK